MATVRFGTSPFYWFTRIESANAAKLMSVQRLETAKSVVCYSRMIWFCFLPQNLASCAHQIALQMRMLHRRNENKHGQN